MLGVCVLGCGQSQPSRASTSAIVSDESDPCVPTAPNQTGPPSGAQESVHLGNGALGTELWPNGRIIIQPDFVQTDGTIAVKWPWWRGEGVTGPLQLSGSRIDDPTIKLDSKVPDGYGDTGFTPSLLIFSTPGCWEVTGTVGEATLTFVTRLEEP
jgi:hypothetical protein